MVHLASRTDTCCSRGAILVMNGKFDFLARSRRNGDDATMTAVAIVTIQSRVLSRLMIDRKSRIIRRVDSYRD